MHACTSKWQQGAAPPAALSALPPEGQAEAEQADQLECRARAGQGEEAARHSWRVGKQPLPGPAARMERGWSEQQWEGRGRSAGYASPHAELKHSHVRGIGRHDRGQQHQSAGECSGPPAPPGGAVHQRPQQSGGKRRNRCPVLGAGAAPLQQRRCQRQLRREEG